MRFRGLGDDNSPVTIADTTLLHNVSDLSRLSKRQLLERLVRTLERIETNMSADSDYIAAALGDLDTAMAGLSARLDTQAQTLASEAAAATDLASLQAVVRSSADKISADAAAIAQMAPSRPPTREARYGSDRSEHPSQPIDTSSTGSTDASSTAADASTSAVDGGASGPLPPSSDTTGGNPGAAADPSAADASGAVSASGDPLPTE